MLSSTPGRSEWARIETSEQCIHCSAPYSFFFQLISATWKSSTQSPDPLHRLCTLARKMDARTLLIEPALDRPDVTSEIDYLDGSAGPRGTAEAFTLSFVNREVAKVDEKVDEAAIAELPGDAIIGQAVVINYKPFGEEADWISYVYEAIFAIPARQRTDGTRDEGLLNNYIHSKRTFEILVHGRAFDVAGVYYCQQNGYTSRCAHAALRMVLNTASTTELIPTRTVGELLEVEPDNVTIEEIETVLAQRQLEPYVGKFADESPIDYRRLVYAVVESGHPALLVFSTKDKLEDHVVAVFGHTLNSDEWHPQAQRLYAGPLTAPYYPSSAWADHFLIHDDNFGPYLCLARDSLSVGRDQALVPTCVIGLMPNEIRLSPVLAENTASAALHRYLPGLAAYGVGRWWDLINRTPPNFVLRTLLITRERYLEHLARSVAHDGTTIPNDQIEAFAPFLPDEFWMTEYTLTNLYAGNKSKLGEVLTRSDQSYDENDAFASVIGMRIPGRMQFILDRGDSVLLPCDCESHLKLYRGSDHPNEW